MKHVLIFANGELDEGPAVDHALAQSAEIIAADGGAELAIQKGCNINLLVGDMDSISPETLQMLRDRGVEILQFPPEKDETDLEIALKEAARRGAEWIRVIGALGGRLDQMLANIYLLNLIALMRCDVRLVSGKQTTWVLQSGDHPLMGEAGDTISLLPLGGAVEGITTTGLQYPLRGETLKFGPARGVSNVIAEAEPRLRFRKGRLLVIHTVGHA